MKVLELFALGHWWTVSPEMLIHSWWYCASGGPLAENRGMIRKRFRNDKITARLSEGRGQRVMGLCFRPVWKARQKHSCRSFEDARPSDPSFLLWERAHHNVCEDADINIEWERWWWCIGNTFVIVLSLKTAVTAGYQDVISVSSVFSHSDKGSTLWSANNYWEDTRDDVPRESLKVDGVAPEVLAVGHRDVVEVVFADSQDVPDLYGTIT